MHFDPEFAAPFQWAQMYREHRFQSVPAWSPAEHKLWKRPRLSEWRKMQGVILPQDQFDRIWRENATRANMGVITGYCSDNLFVIDLDTHKSLAARDWWDGVLAVHNSSIPIETVEQQTGGGGRQVLFRAPAGRVVPTAKTDIGVDIRGHGGFAMLPPSLHESGKAYEWLPGYAPWECEIAIAPLWLLDEIDKLVAMHGGGVPRAHGSNGPEPVSAYDGFGQKIDARETEMARCVWHAVLELYRDSPIRPPESRWDWHASAAYEDYERRVTTRLEGVEVRQGLEQEGRGPGEFRRKWHSAMRRWGDAGFVAAANKPAPAPSASVRNADGADEADNDFNAAPSVPAIVPYEILSIRQMKCMPDSRWLVADLIVEQALGFVFGVPGCLKTFLALDLSLTLATAQPSWWGRKIGHSGAVVYISSEGLSDFKFRILAWEQHRGVNADDAPFRLIRQGINFTQKADIERLIATVQAVIDETGVAVIAIVVDTVSRVLPGVDENLQKDMTIFVAACDALRQKFGATVIGLHHTSKSGTMRGSTVIPGAGDFVIEMRREPGALEGSFFVSKLKAGEDGWEQNFRVTKVELGAMGEHSSLVLDPVVEPVRQPGTTWPERDICRQILAGIDEEWCKGRPWCFARNTSRNAIVNIVKRWKIRRVVVEDILATWTANGVIAEEVCDAKNHISGYRKMLDF